MSMATVKNLVIDQGTTFSLTITVADVNSNEINLTGYTLRAQLRKSYGATSFTSFTVASPAPATGELIISLTDTQTSALKAGRYVYDVEIVAPVGEGSTVTRVLEGIITVTPEVTR
jgi:hypothetical protein